jgi:hypothetical protein
MTLTERHADLLQRAMALSKQRQDVEVQRQQLDAEMLKAAGAIELLDALIADEKAGASGF